MSAIFTARCFMVSDYTVVSCPFVRLSLCDGVGPWLYTFVFVENNYQKISHFKVAKKQWSALSQSPDIPDGIYISLFCQLAAQYTTKVQI